MTCLYIAGPMTGLPEFNYPAFLDAGNTLRSRGYHPLNPVNIDLDEYEGDGTPPWDWYMRRSLELLVQADGVAILPGWQDSKGARLERQVALQLGMNVRPVGQWLPVAP